jgi:signal transduction histidine kinase
MNMPSSPAAGSFESRLRGSPHFAVCFQAFALALLILAGDLTLFMLQSSAARRLSDATASIVDSGSGSLIDSEARELAAARTANRRLTDVAQSGAVVSIVLLIAIALWLSRTLRRNAPSPIADTAARPPDEKVHARAAELTQLSRHLIRVAEEDKAELARELHDTFGSNLTAINMDLNWIARRLPAERPELRERLDRALGTLAATVRSTQEAIDRLRPSQLDNLGLAVALRSHCQELAERAGLAWQIDATEDFERLDRTQSITLYRVAQEALANVAKHACAATVEVELRREEQGIRLRIWDDGVGLPEEITTPSHGMSCMRERVEALGGTLNVTGAPQRGTQVDAFIPVNVP